MKNQLPLLLLLSASTFGLGHELGANGPRDNPETPWGPGDEILLGMARTAQMRWEADNPRKSIKGWYDLVTANPELKDDWTIVEECGDWVRLKEGLPGLRPSESAEDWFHFGDLSRYMGEMDRPPITGLRVVTVFK